MSEAISMPPGRERDVTLREVSRNLRYADRTRAIQAATAVSDDFELRTFDPVPSLAPTRGDAMSACDRSILALRPGRARGADDRHIRACFSMDVPPGIVPPPIPAFRVIIAAADALRPGPTKARLLYMATWDAVPTRPADGAREAVRRLRALLPLLDAPTREQAQHWLDTTAVDLIEGRPDDAIARVRRAFAGHGVAIAYIADQPAVQARGLVIDLLAARDLARAVEVTDLLPPASDCSVFDEGFNGIINDVLPQEDESVVAAYMARLEASGSLARLCPERLANDLAAGVWLKAGDERRALAAADASRSAMVILQTRLGIVERRLRRGDTVGALALLRAAAAAPALLNQGSPADRVAAARARIVLIHHLTEAGEPHEAERLAGSFAGPGWRGFAYSVMVATASRDHAGPGWDGPNLELTDVPADH